jgi:hypothetical protein
MDDKNFFISKTNVFLWKYIKTFLVRSQYNEMLNFVVKEYFTNQYKDPTKLPNFLNVNYCLTLSKFLKEGGPIPVPTTTVSSNRFVNVIKREDSELEIGQAALKIAEGDLSVAGHSVELYAIGLPAAEALEINKLKKEVEQRRDISKIVESLKNVKTISNDLKMALDKLTDCLKKVIEAVEEVKRLEIAKNTIEATTQLKLEIEKNEYEKAFKLYEIAQSRYAFNGSNANEAAMQTAKVNWEIAANKYSGTVARPAKLGNTGKCAEIDCEATDYCLPQFSYIRQTALIQTQVPDKFKLERLDFKTNGLSIGGVVWLYFYERMGIFKILSALMDDYNYRGKYTISGNRTEKTAYSELMDSISTMYRLGIGSNLRDRICTYQRVLGVNIENNLNIESVQNKGFMQTFNKLVDYMLEYYKSKQLAQAIQVQSTLTAPARSSVATQTSIRDTMNLLRQQFEPSEYGRNQMTVFLGIAMVHGTLCLINMLRKEIGIPDQYERPEEFIPAAYDILVTKQPITLNSTNRFIIYDNCASYGYRLFTDIEMADMSTFTTIASGSTLDVWLNDIEGIVEGYNSAFKSVEEPTTAIL